MKKGTLLHCESQDWYMPQCEDSHCVAGSEGADLINTRNEAIKLWNTRTKPEPEYRR